VAWVRAVRGGLAAASADHETPGARRPVTAAYSGYWLIESRVAVLLRREDRLDEAAAVCAAVRAHGTSRAGPDPGAGALPARPGSFSGGWHAVAWGNTMLP